MKLQDIFLRGVQALVLSVVACGSVGAETYPSRPVTLVVPYPPGGASDVMARTVAPLLSQRLGQPVVVNNVGGAGGAIGIQRMLAAPADGYTLLLGTPSEAVLVPLSNAAVRYRSEDLRLAGVFGVSHLMLATRADFPADDIDAFVEQARAKPDGYNYGSIGIGSMFHVAGEALKDQARIPLVHVPYNGVGPMVQALLGGQLDVAFLPAAGTMLDLIDTQKLKLMGPASAGREARYPQVPTLSEGKYLKDFQFSIWSGIFVARGTPEPVMKTIHSAVDEVLRLPEFRQTVEARGGTPGQNLTQDALDHLYDAETSRYRSIAKAIKLDPR